MGLLSNRVERGSLKPGDHIYSWRTAYIYAHHGIYVGENKVIHFTRRGQEVGTGTVLDLLLLSSGPYQSLVSCPTCIPSEEGHGVVSSCLDCFLAGGILYCFEYAVSRAFFLAKARGGTCTLAVSDPDDVVVHRAKYLLDNGFGGYNLFQNNCEIFAIYCKTGLLVLDQSTVTQSGQVASYNGGPIASVLSTSLRLLTTNVYGMAATTQSGQVASYIGGPIASALSTSLRLVTTNVYGMVATAVGVYCASRYAADIGMRRDVVKVSVEDLTRRLATDLLQAIQPTVPALPPPDSEVNTVTADEDVWKSYLEQNPSAKTFKKNALAHFSLLREIFYATIATGRMAIGPQTAANVPRAESTYSVDVDAEEEGTGDSNEVKKDLNCSRLAEGSNSHFKKKSKNSMESAMELLAKFVSLRIDALVQRTNDPQQYLAAKHAQMGDPSESDVLTEDPASIEICIELLEKMENLDDKTYRMAIKKLSKDKDFRRSFVQIKSKCRHGFILSLME